MSLETPLRIVAIGGGTGLSTLLHGLKPYVPQQLSYRDADPYPAIDITAIVTVTDDGGSSGRLRRTFGVPPPGDIRSCMTALARDEDLLAKLFAYRFESGQGLKGHNFGNLFLTALAEVTGDFQTAVRVASAVLAIAGRIYPSTNRPVVLGARLSSGREVWGETRIAKAKSRIASMHLNPADCGPLPETLEALDSADLICLGPGSLYTSVIPNLLVQGIPQCIAKSKAVKVYVSNLMGQPNETLGFRASDHVRPILEHSDGNLLDYVIVNNQAFTEEHLERYKSQGIGPVERDIAELDKLGVTVIEAGLLADQVKARHDPAALASIVISLAEEGRRRRYFDVEAETTALCR